MLLLLISLLQSFLIWWCHAELMPRTVLYSVFHSVLQFKWRIGNCWHSGGGYCSLARQHPKSPVARSVVWNPFTTDSCRKLVISLKRSHWNMEDAFTAGVKKKEKGMIFFSCHISPPLCLSVYFFFLSVAQFPVGKKCLQVVNKDGCSVMVGLIFHKRCQETLCRSWGRGTITGISEGLSFL